MSVVHGKSGIVGRSKLAAALACLALGGCERACKNDHPYVPPGAEASVPDAGPEEDAAAAPLSPGDAGGDAVLALPPGATSLDLEGIPVSMPDREIVLALVDDFDGDGRRDALAVVRAPGGAGEVVHFRGGVPSGALVLRGPPPSLEPSCAPAARLQRIGPRSAYVEIGAACATGSGTRALAVVRLGKSVSSAVDALVSDPASAPRIAIDAHAPDRDGDGNDDVVLEVTMDAAGPPFEPGPRLTAKLAFFDRPAGPSRDSAEPDASLRAIAAQVAKAKPAAVPGIVHQMRSLYRALCAEGGAPRIDKVRGGAAPSCGTSRPLEDAGVALVKAYAAQGDAARAFAAADLASVAPATRTAAKVAEVDKALAAVAPDLEARGSRSLNVLVDPPHQHPEWGPLAFESSDKLLVRHGETVSRIDLASWEQEELDVPAWPSHVVSPDGRSRWLEAYHACDGVALRATFAPLAEGDVEDVLLPVAPRLGSRCAGGRGEAARAVPIAWGPRGLETIVSGQPLLVRLDAKAAAPLGPLPEEAPPRGSPRSPSGRALAIATSRGVLVRTDKTTLRRAPELAPYADLRHCTTTDDGAAVACVKKGRVVVATF